MPTKIKDLETVLFIGDSITDAGRREGTPPLGCGFVRMFADMLTVREPRKQVLVINRGIAGNTIDDLRSRWHEDVLLNQPDWLVIKVGINDLNRFLCDKNMAFLSPEGFEQIYDDLLTLTRQRLPKVRILLITPFHMSTDDVPGSYRAKVQGIIGKYVSAVKRMSARHKTLLIDLHALFQARLKFHHPDVYGDHGDVVHPRRAGILLIAETVYEKFCNA